jgi:hypothetical protein
VGNYLRFSGKTTGGADLYVVGLNYGEAGVKSYITPIRE